MVASPAWETDHTLFATAVLVRDADYVEESFILKSVDNGQSWQVVDNFAEPRWPDLAISPDYATDQTVYVARHSGIYRTRDGSATWELVSPPPFDPEMIFADPRLWLSPDFAQTPHVWFAYGGKGRLYRSEDGGQTWFRLRGANGAYAYNLRYEAGRLQIMAAEDQFAFPVATGHDPAGPDGDDHERSLLAGIGTSRRLPQHSGTVPDASLREVSSRFLRRRPPLHLSPLLLSLGSGPTYREKFQT